MKRNLRLLKELAEVREEIVQCEVIQRSRTACPRRAVEAGEREAKLRLRKDELERSLGRGR